MLAAQHPKSAFPGGAVQATLHGQYIADRLLQATLEDAPQSGSLFGISQLVVGRIDIDR